VPSMEPLELLRKKITGFPGYATEIERRRSDEYVRSYLGEALADLAARQTLSPEVVQRLDALVLRVSFADQQAFSRRVNVGTSGAGDEDAVAVADAATIELAERAATLEPAATNRYLEEVTAALDAREAALVAAARSDVR
jgi:hypothetical protein